MFIENFKIGWQLGLYSCRFVLNHKLLLLLPIMSALAIIGALTLIYFAADSVATGNQINPLIILLIVLAYFLAIFISIFFNVVLIAMVNSYLENKKATFSEGFASAINRVPAIFSWTLIVGTVGLLIRLVEALEEKFHLPSILSTVLDVGWAAATYFVVPIICFQGVASPKGLYDESSRLISKVWGQDVIKILGAGAFGMVLSLPVIIGYFVLTQTSSAYHFEFYVILTFIAVCLMAFTSIINGTLQTIFYKYADTQYIPSEFNSELLTKAVVHKIEKT